MELSESSARAERASERRALTAARGVHVQLERDGLGLAGCAGHRLARVVARVVELHVRDLQHALVGAGQARVDQRCALHLACGGFSEARAPLVERDVQHAAVELNGLAHRHRPHAVRRAEHLGPCHAAYTRTTLLRMRALSDTLSELSLVPVARLVCKLRTSSYAQRDEQRAAQHC